MKARAVIREAWRDVYTGTARVRTLATSAAILAIIIAGADIMSTHQLLERAREYRRSGASISILTAESQIDGERCDRLTAIPGVRAAGALRTTSHPIKPIVLPRAPIPVFEASTGFVALIGSESRGAGVLLGPEASEAFGLYGQGSIATSITSVRVAGTYPYPNDGRRPGFSYAAIAPKNSVDAFDECWVDTWPVKTMTGALLSTLHVSSDKSKQSTIAQLNATQGKSFDGNAFFQQRTTRFAGVCAALFGVVLGLFSVRIRRLSLASALHAGVSQRALFFIVSLATLAWVLLSLALAVPIATLISTTLGDGVAATVLPGLGATAPLWLGGFAGAWLGVSTVKERQLFHYFKTR